MYSIDNICRAVKGNFIAKNSNSQINHLVYDSRRAPQPFVSLFFALVTSHNNGHRFVEDAFRKGVRNFVISEAINTNELVDCNIIMVENCLDALQQLTSFHRVHFSIPVIGITGSNGKTIVKEWLNQLLQPDYKIVRSPKSFNSQIGVPLSVWQMNEVHQLGIFEAGISVSGEMRKLAEIIRPTIGILTNIGSAHSEGFKDSDEKLEEKLILFHDADVLIARSKDLSSRKYTHTIKAKILLWGFDQQDDFFISHLHKQKQRTEIELVFQSQHYKINFHFTDDASVENAISCVCVLLKLGYDEATIDQRLAQLHAIDMRLQLDHGINDCLVINDSYSADLTSLKIALDFLKQQSSGLKRTVILSEFFESGKNAEDLYQEIAELLQLYGINKAVVVGENISDHIRDFLSNTIELQSYLSADDFIREFKSSQFFNEVILIKGARRFEFERIAYLFEKKLHQTVLEINLNSLAHNLKEYQKQLKPDTKIMAMVKAFSYGSGGAEIASVLQYHNVDYLGVAYADEGVELVKAGISLPTMVMNTEASSFRSIVAYHLQPVIYSFDLLEEFSTYIQSQGLASFPVHIEIETGMNRLGFSIEEMEAVAKKILKDAVLSIESAFTHLAASEDPAQDAFTMQQSAIFENALTIFKKYISYPFLKHIANSAAIIRHPKLQMDMVRLGIGLYGVEIEHASMAGLRAVASLRATIAQIRQVKKGDSVSYNRKGIVKRDSVIATVRIGYADGYSRRMSNGVGKMWLNGNLVPVVGTVCMDMTMIDITGIDGVKEGDEVIIFGPELPVQELASWMNTIPYEVMTGISQRVKRIYFHE